MHITIYDKHQNTANKPNHEQSFILGVHNFHNILLQFENKKNLKILINGDPNQIIENVLWNQFFNYTLLKDIYRSLSSNTSTKNSFFKINGKTYRLGQYLDWANFQFLKQQILKILSITIQFFMFDGLIKTITIQIGNRNANNYDLIFSYKSNQFNSSISLSSHKSRNKTYSNLPKHQSLNQARKCHISKSLFQENLQKEKMSISSSKYSTQKKGAVDKHNYRGKSIKENQRQKKQVSKLKESTKNIYNIHKSDKQNQFISIKQTIQNYQSKPDTFLQIDSNTKKQEVAVALLYKKDEKIKQYKNMLDVKEKYYQQKIIKIQKDHQIQVSNIKKEVQTVLANYKKKNKLLKKQNECLTQMNQKLLISNNKLQVTINTIQNQLASFKDSQQRLQNTNQLYAAKFADLQIANKRLNQQISQQNVMFNDKINQKNLLLQQYKNKYERLFSNIKMATQKQNIY